MPAKPRKEPYPEPVAVLLSQGDASAAQQLAALAEDAEKPLAKAARRALHQLRLIGVEPPARPFTAATTQARSDTRAQKAWMSTPSALGRRVLLFVWEDPGGGSSILVEALLDDEGGLTEISGSSMGRRRIQEHLERLKSRETWVLEEVPVDWARHVMRDAVRLAHATRSTQPDGTSRWMRVVGEPDRDYPVHPVYGVLDPAAVQADPRVSADAAQLFTEKPFSSWFLEPQRMAPAMERLAAVLDSKLVLEEHQKRERVDRMLAEAADELLTGEEMARWQRRLEDSAFVLHFAGNEDAAKRAVKHALSISPEQPPREQPFFVNLVERSLALVYAMLERHQEKSRPGSAA